MERFASAYGRALYPRRYGPGDGMNSDGRQPMALAPGGLELAMGAGIYHAVVAAEGWLDGLRQRLAAWRARPKPRPSATPVGCG
jgi:hypothetical protein